MYPEALVHLSSSFARMTFYANHVLYPCCAFDTLCDTLFDELLPSGIGRLYRLLVSAAFVLLLEAAQQVLPNHS